MIRRSGRRWGPEVFYLGCLGSTRTHAKRVARLEEAGFTPEDIARIHAPVGLDIGARGPAEIAVSVLGRGDAEAAKGMRFGPVPPGEAEGAVLAHAVALPGGKLKKGHVLRPEDVAALAAAGLAEVIVARLEPGDVGEDRGSLAVGARAGAGSGGGWAAARGAVHGPGEHPGDGGAGGGGNSMRLPSGASMPCIR